MSGLGSGTRGFHPLSSADDSVLALDQVVVSYAARGVSVGGKDEFRAVDGVTLSVRSGRSVGLVGESGCGKSSLGRSILGLAPLTSGEISIGERGATSARRRGHVRRRLSRSVQIVFQDPYSSLDPRQSVAGIVAEPMVVHRIGTPADRRDRVAHLLEQVGLPSSFGDRYPHELSGGQRQRVCIARSLSVEPVLLICDEPTSALDVSIQAQVVELLQGLAEDRDLTYLFITHDLALLPQLTEEVAVMYLGRLVETGPESEVLRHPRHPYTVSLLAAAPVLGHRREKAIERIASGDLAVGPPDRGCPFRSRCWLYRELDASDAAACEEQAPGLDVVPGGSGRRTACHHHHALSAVEVEVAEQRPGDESAIELGGGVRGQNGP